MEKFQKNPCDKRKNLVVKKYSKWNKQSKQTALGQALQVGRNQVDHHYLWVKSIFLDKDFSSKEL